MSHIIHTDEGPLEVDTIEQVIAIQDAREARRSQYNMALQLDLLYKDIEAGLFGEAAKAGGFATYIRDIKQRYPKPGDSV